MSADWFCKIGEKKVGPLNGQQLKTIVAKGQLKPEHLVRRGSEGPWVPAGRIKGLFPEGPAGTQPQGKTPQATAKSLPKAARKPSTAPTGLPTAAEAPTPPAARPPQESSGGHPKHHVQMNLDILNIEATPVTVSRRKVKAGLQGMKKDERKKLTIMLLCLIGGGMTIGLIVLTLFFIKGSDISGKSSSSDLAKAKDPILTGKAADSIKKAEEKPVDKKPAQEREPGSWKSVGSKILVDNKVEVNVLKPTRGAPPEGAKTEETYVLIVPVTLELKSEKVKQVEFTSWADDSLKKKVLLKDDQEKIYELLEQVADKESDGKAITKTRIKVYLIFQAPTSKKLKFLHLALPVSAFQADGAKIGYEIKPSDIQSEAAKSATADKANKPAKVDEGDAEDSTPKSDKKKPSKTKTEDTADSDPAEATPKNDKKKPDKAKTEDTADSDPAEATPKNDKKKPDKAKAADEGDADNVMPPKEP